MYDLLDTLRMDQQQQKLTFHQSFPEVRLDLIPLGTDHDTLIAHQPSTIQVLIGG